MATSEVSIPDPALDKPPRPRRWIPLSLRMFVAILTLLGVGSILWIGVPAYRQHVAIRDVELLGGRVLTRGGRHEWLRRYVENMPTRAFDTVFGIAFIDTQISDVDLANVARFSDLESLQLNGEPVTDSGMNHLRSLTKLRWLFLHGTQISDAGLSDLKGLTSLTHLDLGKTNITDAGLQSLAELKDLIVLDLKNTRVTGRGIVYLRALPDLRILNLTDTGFDDEDLADLKELASLETVYLGNTAATLEGLADLRKACPNLLILFSDGGCVGLHSSGDAPTDDD